MRRKEVNRCRREWDVLASDLHLNKPAAEWARRWGKPLLGEVKRLREELKLKNKKRRQVYSKLELERDDLDALIDEIEKVIDKLPADPLASVDSCLISQQLNKILAPYMEDHDDGDD
jgi:hypothetical protein